MKVCVPIHDDSAPDDHRMVLGNTLTLADVQNQIIQYGPEHFDPGNRMPLNYVKTLFIVMAYDEVGLRYLIDSKFRL